MFRIGIVINVAVTGVRGMFLRDCGRNVEVRARRDSQARRNESLEQKGDRAYKHRPLPATATMKRRYFIHGWRADEGGLGTSRKSEGNENSDSKYSWRSYVRRHHLAVSATQVMRRVTLAAETSRPRACAIRRCEIRPARQTLHIPNTDSAAWRSVRMNLRPGNLPRFFVCEFLGSEFSEAA